MAVYQYEVLTETRQLLRGTLTADNEAAARRELESRGLSVVDLMWRPDVDQVGTLDDQQLGTLVHAVGAAAASRAPLDFTLALLADDAADPQLASVARRISQRLAQGATLNEAVDELQHELPAEVRGLVRAGIESGNLAGAFEQFTLQRLASRRLAQRIRTAIAYPVIVLSILVPILLFLSLFVTPMFADLYQEFDLMLPPVTEVILQTARQLPGLVAGLLILVLALPLALRLLGGRWLFHRFRAAIPLFGRLWTWSAQREFAALLASFLDQRLPLPQAVEHTGQLISDRNVARACRRVRQRLEAGETLGDSLAQSISFDRTLSAMALWGESYGLLPDALHIAADVFEDRVEQQLAFVRRLVPPATLIIVGTLALFVLIGLFIPLVKLIEGLSQ